MAHVILLPALSPTMETGRLAKWLVKEGDAVSPGDVIAEIETDKATMELETDEGGVVARISGGAGGAGGFSRRWWCNRRSRCGRWRIGGGWGADGRGAGGSGRDDGGDGGGIRRWRPGPGTQSFHHAAT